MYIFIYIYIYIHIDTAAFEVQDNKERPITGFFEWFSQGLKVVILEPWKSRGVFGKVILIIELPFIIGRTASVPIIGPEEDDKKTPDVDQISILDDNNPNNLDAAKPEDDNNNDDDDDEDLPWNKTWAFISSLLSPLFLFYMFDIELYWLAGVIGVIVGTLVLLFTEESASPRQSLIAQEDTPRPIPQRITAILVLLLSFTSACAWTMLFADDLVELLVTLAELLGFPASLVGITFLTWGNSIGDLAANLALAKESPRMAAAGCFGGPLFNVLVGGGVSFLAATSNGPLTVSQPDVTEYVIIFSTFALLLIATPLVKFHISRSFGIGLCLVYCGYLGWHVVDIFVTHDY